ncbi:MAG: DcaP family trimeric outer membrane transporter [Halieaceae bacterium]
MKALLILLVLMPGLAPAAGDPPASLEEMWKVLQQQQSQIEELRRENAELRKRMDAGTMPALQEQVVDSSTDVSADMGVSRTEEDADTRLEIYGFAQVDAIYDFDRVDPDWNDASRPSKIPVQDSAVFGSDGETIISARQSRLGFRSSHEVGGSELKVWLEWDLFAAGNDAGELELNTRHAWGQWKNFGGGQTWSNWMDIDIFPNTIDYWGPPGMVFIRKPQLRYTHMVGSSGSHWAVALEDPSSDVDPGDVRDIDPDLADTLQPKDSLPDLTIKWRGEFDWGHYQVAGIARKLDVETVSDGLGGNPDNTPKEDTFGWGVNFTSVITTLGSDQLKLGLVYGEGIASYFNDGGTAIGLEQGGLEAVESLGVSLWYDHYWNSHWSSSIGWGMHEQDNTELQSSDAFNTGQLAQLNLLYSKGKFLTGVEAIWMQRENNNGDDNDDFRLQYSLKYSFDKAF